MEFAVGTALGGVSLLAGFKGAIDGYQLLTEIATSLPQTSVGVKIDIEKQRLASWGDYYGLSSNTTNPPRSRQVYSDETTKILLLTLAQIRNTVTDLDQLVNKYGLHPVDIDLNQTSDQQLYPKSPLVEALAKAVKASNVKALKRQKIKWAVDDNAKINKLIDQLKYLNDSLDELANPPQQVLFDRVFSTHLLPQPGNQNFIPLVQRATRNRFLVSYSAFTQMKEAKLASLATQSLAPEIDLTSLTIEPDPLGSSKPWPRSLATYEDQPGTHHPVIVEWKFLEDPSDYASDLKRAKQIGCQLSVQNLPESRTLDCYGTVHDKDFEATHGRQRLGTVYGLPAPDVETDRLPASLSDLLETAQTGSPTLPLLGDRFKLAQSLASALLLIHASDVHHRSIDAKNILFFRKQVSLKPPPITEPFVAGFAHSKLVSDPQLCPDQDADAVYRRPEYIPAQTPYTKLDDIYSLGVVLLEIGLWKPARLWKRAGMSNSEFRDELLKELQSLGGCVGEIYQNAVHCCLTADFGVQAADADGTALEKAFWSRVVKQLELCRA
jgi:hypothetical protein